MALDLCVPLLHVNVLNMLMNNSLICQSYFPAACSRIEWPVETTFHTTPQAGQAIMPNDGCKARFDSKKYPVYKRYFHLAGFP